MAALSPCCCMQAFSSYGKCSLFFIVAHRLLTAVASLVAEHGLWAHRLQSLWPTGLAALQHVKSTQSRDQSPVSCTGRQILNH